MQLTGKRIQLCPFDHSDKDLFIELTMSGEMMEHVYTPFTYDEAKAAFEAKAQPWSETSDSWFTLGITELSTGEKLGSLYPLPIKMQVSECLSYFNSRRCDEIMVIPL